MSKNAQILSLERPPRKRKVRTHQARREEAERRILMAAARIVAEKGLERFTLAEVGEAAGYSRGLPRHYFGGKDDLTLALARFIAEHPVVLARPQPPERAGLAALLDMAGFYIDIVQEYPTNVRAFFIVLAGALTNPALKEPMARMTRARVAAIEKHILAGITAGDIRDDVDPPAMAQIILGQLRGIHTQWLNDPGSIDMAAVRAETTASLEAALRPRLPERLARGARLK